MKSEGRFVIDTHVTVRAVLIGISQSAEAFRKARQSAEILLSLAARWTINVRAASGIFGTPRIAPTCAGLAVIFTKRPMFTNVVNMHETVNLPLLSAMPILGNESFKSLKNYPRVQQTV